MSSNKIETMRRSVPLHIEPRLHTIVQQIARHQGVSESEVINAVLRRVLDGELPDVDLTLEPDLGDRLSYEEMVQSLQEPPHLLDDQ